MKKEFVATVYVIEDQRVLLIKHPKLGKWLPPGGHLEEGETPDLCALRELEEETGIKGEVVSSSPLAFKYWNAKTIPSPFLLLLEEIPAWKEQAAHQHIDHVFLGRVIEIPSHLGPMVCRWFSLEEIETLEDDVEIFEETKEVIRALL